MQIANNKQCFVDLWRELDAIRDNFMHEHRRFCIRRVLQTWFPQGAGGYSTEDLIIQVCRACHLAGYDDLPSAHENPLKLREFLRALVGVVTGLGVRKIKYSYLDSAYANLYHRKISWWVKDVVPKPKRGRRRGPHPNPPEGGGVKVTKEN